MQETQPASVNEICVRYSRYPQAEANAELLKNLYLLAVHSSSHEDPRLVQFEGYILAPLTITNMHTADLELYPKLASYILGYTAAIAGEGIDELYPDLAQQARAMIRRSSLPTRVT